MSFRSSLSYSLIIGSLVLVALLAFLYFPMIHQDTNCRVYKDCAASALATTFLLIWLLPLAIIPSLAGFLLWKRPLKPAAATILLVLFVFLFISFVAILAYMFYAMFRIAPDVRGWELAYYILQDVLLGLPLVLAIILSLFAFRHTRQLANPVEPPTHPERRKGRHK